MSEGIDIARQRIAKEAEAKTGFLDLGRLGLSRLPDELFELGHLQALNLGGSLYSLSRRHYFTHSKFGQNNIQDDLSRLADLINLTHLSISKSEISNLTQLARIENLEELDCSATKITSLDPISNLHGLRKLDFSTTKVSNIEPIANLKELRRLFCHETEVDDLAPLAQLTKLSELFCFETNVEDLEPIAGLRNLQCLDCSATEIWDVDAIAELPSLRHLDCSSTAVDDLDSIAELANLEYLNCSVGNVESLEPIAQLVKLKELDCSATWVTDLKPIIALHLLQTLKFSSTKIRDITPIIGLKHLKDLDCSYTLVGDLNPINELTSLQNLECHNCCINCWSDSLWRSGSLEEVYASKAELAGIPGDLLSLQNCLPAIRAHLDDLGEHPEHLTDVKLIVLGNGRIGKTQIVNRLQGKAYKKDADSTHGVSLVRAPIPGSTDENFNIWDFGGQDIYFGTHMLFLRSRAVFMLVWTPESDDAETHEHGGMMFRNQPVAWWLDCVRRFGSEGAPLVVVQNQLDRDEDRGDHPALAESRDEWKFCRSVAYSAATDEGRGALDDHLKHAAKRFNPPLIGKGRLDVMRRLQAWHEEDRERAPEEKCHRTLTFDAFKALCEQTGGISDPVQFLHFLHNAGLVFWREDLFQSRVILDQAWVLDAVYAVFHREKCLKIIRGRGGQFTRAELGMMIWDAEGYSEKDKDLFLSFMLSCDICFRLRRGSEDAETVYVAPDHLPEDWEPEARQERWGADAPDAELIFDYESLPPILMRNLIARIGGRAGLSCDYWQKGFYGYESRTNARVLVEQEMADRLKGSIRIQARGGRAAELVDEMEAVLLKEERRLRLRSKRQVTERRAKRSDHVEEAAESALVKLDFVPEPTEERTYFVSYAWEDASSSLVNAFCKRAEEQGITVRRDKDVMKLGDSIAKFMHRLARGDRVIVVLSDKYLHSPFCMYELYNIWVQARHDEDRFRKRIRVFTQADAKVDSIPDRAAYATYWDQECQRNVAATKDSFHLLDPEDQREISNMREFASHVAKILRVVKNTLQPRSLDELVSYSFDDGDFDD